MQPLDFSALSLLIVDDNAHMRHMYRNVLSSLNISNIHDASNGQAALEILKDKDIDIVICDWNMSPINGLEFAKLVRNDPIVPNPFVPIIMVTGHTGIQHVKDARDAGVNEFLAKPISAKLLYSRLASVVQNNRVFIRSESFFGPDRRRRRAEFGGPDKREHENQSATDRRTKNLPFKGSEKRQGYPGYIASERRGDEARR